MKKHISISILFILTVCSYSAILFEIKDLSNNTVMTVSDDGLRIFNEGDTLMVISSNEIKAFIDNSAKDKALSRSFSVSTNASGKDGSKDVFEVSKRRTVMREGENGNEYTDFSPENIFLGHNAGWQTTPDTTQINTGQRNVFVGNDAGYSNTVGYDNIFVGTSSGYSISLGVSNTAVGVNSLNANTSGSQNTSIGFESLLRSSTGSWNTSLGMYSMWFNTEGSYNTCLGVRSGWGNIIGEGNTSVGSYSYDNAAAGDNTFCTMIGYGADVSSVFSYNNGTAVGYGAMIDDDDQVRVGNSSVLSIGGYVGWTTLGKKEYLKNISDEIVGLEFISKLKPVTYYLDVEKINKDLNFNDDNEKTRMSALKSAEVKRSGLIYEEVEKAASETGYDFTGIDSPDNKNGQYGIRYSEFVIPLIKAVQEQQEIIEKLEERISELENK